MSPDCAGAGRRTSRSWARAGVQAAMTASATRLAATREEDPHLIILAPPEPDQGFQ